jgi:hypothetical protein
MTHAQYYRNEARHLTSMARASKYPEIAAQLEAQARLYLGLARVCESHGNDLTRGLHEFNSQQMRKGLRRNPSGH